MRSSHAERNPHLVDEHDRENGLIDVPGFAAGGEKRQTKAGQKGHMSHMCPKKGNSMTTRKWVGVQQSVTYGKPWTLFMMILSWALLQARMGTPVV